MFKLILSNSMPNFNNRLAQVRTESLRYAVISCHGIAWFFLWYSQCRQLFSHFVIVFMDGRNSHTKLAGDVAFIAHTGVLSQVSGNLLFLGADTVGILRGFAGAECGNLGFHLEDQVRQLPQEHKDGIDMARDYLRRSHVLVVCGDTVDESMKNDIAIAERLRITATTLDGILTVKGQGREKGGSRHERG